MSGSKVRNCGSVSTVATSWRSPEPNLDGGRDVEDVHALPLRAVHQTLHGDDSFDRRALQDGGPISSRASFCAR
jgi:hypothetical protein